MPAIVWVASHDEQIFGVPYLEGQIVDTTGWDWADLHHAMVNGMLVTGIAGAKALPFSFTAAATWTIRHNLGGYPVVEILDDTGRAVLSDLEYPDLNTVVATHAMPMSGIALVR